MTAGTPVAVVVPVLNEAALAPALAERLSSLNERAEVVVVDGESSDATVAALVEADVRVVTSSPGRARQMNAGAAATSGDPILFLHADTVLPQDGLTAVRRAVAAGNRWGRFDVRIVGESRWLPIVAWFMNRRSRLSGICTGDQALFVRREAFESIGGFPEQPLMEDIELSRRLRRLGPPACLRERVTTSGRRWDSRGALRTILLMWQLRFDYWRGVAPTELARRYG